MRMHNQATISYILKVFRRLPQIIFLFFLFINLLGSLHSSSPETKYGLIQANDRDVNRFAIPADHKRIIVHVGLHKTGTTSIQAFLHRNRDTLKELNIDVYEGLFIPSNHVELHCAAMRINRDSPYKLLHNLKIDEDFRKKIKNHISEYIKSSTCECIVFSSEGLSYLYYADELKRLRSYLPKGRIEIVIYIRNAQDYLRSYKNQLRNTPVPSVIEKDSFAYTESDSWLLDFETRISKFVDIFGEENVTILNYDEEVQQSQNIIPSFIRILGVTSYFKKEDWETIFLNKTRKGI